MVEGKEEQNKKQYIFKELKIIEENRIAYVPKNIIAFLSENN
jgi:hypothetical protein